METYNNNDVRFMHKARSNKNDEFYTMYSDIEEELSNYADHFKGNIVFCNCDDPVYSEFFRYFVRNFKYLEMRELHATHYEKDCASYALRYDGKMHPEKFLNWVRAEGKISKYHTDLKGDGDFCSPECVEILKKSDIVVTNPPFSLFRPYFRQLMEYRKKFLILGNLNSAVHKDIWPYLKRGEAWLGVDRKNIKKTFWVRGDAELRMPPGWKDEAGNKFTRVFPIVWYTNMEHDRRINEHIPLVRRWSRDKERYQKYDNYNAIDVPLVAQIPMGYKGKMGVPVSFLMKHNPGQFHIHEMGIASSDPSFKPSRIYANPILVKNGKESKGNAINSFLALGHSEKPSGVYYKANGKYLTMTYSRILISHNKKAAPLFPSSSTQGGNS